MLHSQSGASEPTGQQIATATLRLVGERGAEQVRLADVVKDLGISREAIARQCATDADLWRITADFIAQQMVERWSASLVSEHSPPARLRSLVSAQIGLIVETPALRDILFSRRLRQNHLVLTRELARARQQFQRTLAEIVRQGRATGDFPAAPDPDETARRIVVLLQAVVLRWAVAFEADIALEDIWTRLDALLGCSTESQATVPDLDASAPGFAKE